MTNKIALVDEVEGTGGNVKYLRESIKYFDKVFAVESKDLKFFFDDDKEVHDNLMYCYFMQVSPHQQNLDLLNKNLLETINSNKLEDQKKTLEVCFFIEKVGYFLNPLPVFIKLGQWHAALTKCQNPTFLGQGGLASTQYGYSPF